MALLTGRTEDGQEVAVQVKPDGRLVAEGLTGPTGGVGAAGPTGPVGPAGPIGPPGVYQTGAWTPRLEGSTTPGTFTGIRQFGSYVRIGNLVYVQFEIIWSSGTGTGGLRIAGLPFPGSALQSAIAIGSSSAGNVAVPAGTQFFLSISPGASSISVDFFPVGGSGPNSCAYDNEGHIYGSVTYIATPLP